MRGRDTVFAHKVTDFPTPVTTLFNHYVYGAIEFVLAKHGQSD
ncbi:MAG: hypothetical protein U0452_14280 [Anaerolineae bacterium]